MEQGNLASRVREICAEDTPIYTNPLPRGMWSHELLGRHGSQASAEANAMNKGGRGFLCSHRDLIPPALM